MLETADEYSKDLLLVFHDSPYLITYLCIAIDQQNSYWSCCKECVESSVSGLHYNYQKAYSFRFLISSVKCSLVNLAVKNRTLLEYQAQGVSITLEKSPGNFRVDKLRAILLLEADCNGQHKINFNGSMMPRLEAIASTSYKIIGSRRSQVATYLVLNKKLVAETLHIKKAPTVIT